MQRVMLDCILLKQKKDISGQTRKPQEILELIS